MTFKEWLPAWFEHYVKPTAKVRTYERYRQLSLHILPHLGEYDVNALTPMVLQKYVSELLVSGNRKTGRGLSPNTVNAIISLMQNALKAALAAGAVQTYTAGKIKRPKNTEKPVECFSLAEQKAIERYVLNGKKPKMTGIVICLYTGLRIGELLALEWSDIDFEKQVLTVSKSCHYGHDANGRYIRVTEAPKTEHSARIIRYRSN